MGGKKERDPADCPGLDGYLHIIRDMSWKEVYRKRGERAHPDPADAAEKYSAARPLVIRVEQLEVTASGLNSEAYEAEKGEGLRFHYEDSKPLQLLNDRTESLLSEHNLEADFGTLCHRVIELRIKNGRTSADETAAGLKEIKDISISLLGGGLSEKDSNLLFSEAAALSGAFFGSVLWSRASEYGNFESELPFTSRLERDGKEFLVSGVMDLVFETPEFVHVVDFKTDRWITPGEYDLQLEIYRDAASAIFGKPAVCSLFYLRGAEEIGAFQK